MSAVVLEPEWNVFFCEMLCITAESQRPFRHQQQESPYQRGQAGKGTIYALTYNQQLVVLLFIRCVVMKSLKSVFSLSFLPPPSPSLALAHGGYPWT